MKIYTKSGDKGKTFLFGGRKVNKNDLRIAAYGNVDELNSLIGVILAEDPPEEISKKLTRIQNELMVLGSDLASPMDVTTTIPRVTQPYVSRLEKEIDSWQKKLPQLKKFILPGGGRIGSKLHLARAVTRRSERSIANLANQEKINAKVLMYVNRLSDWFFVAARQNNKIESIKEVQWLGRDGSY